MKNFTKRKKDFPIFKRKINGKSLIYLDSSSTSQKPLQVIEAMNNFYFNHNANIHRGIYALSEEATLEFEKAHDNISKFINSKFEEAILTSGTTESINLVAYSLLNSSSASSNIGLRRNDEIIITEMEHHSNLVPWQQIAKIKGCKLKIARIDKNGNLDLEHLESLTTKKTKIIAATHISNVLGTINDVREIAKIAHNKDALFLVDAAQSVPHINVDVKKIDCDFLAFSGHKMLGPTGTGILYGKKELLEKLSPFKYGGDMINSVNFQDSKWNKLPWKFEAGTPNIAGTIGLSEAVKYLNNIGMEKIEANENKLTKHLLKRLSENKKIKIYGNPKKRAGAVSFNLGKIHAHDASEILSREGICVRAGNHCAMPLLNVLGVNASIRASLYIYNEKRDIDKLMQGLQKVQDIFK